MEPIVIGIVGKKGSGKSTAAGYLADKFGAEALRFSGPLEEILRHLALPQTRENLQLLIRALRHTFGNDIIVNRMRADIQKLHARVIILDGLRWMEDYYLLRSFPRNMLLAITAPLSIRYARLGQEHRRKDDASEPLQEFIRKERRVSARLVPQITKLADFVIRNHGDQAEFFAALDEFAAHIGVPGQSPQRKGE